jgi:60 kDa SS-A/Ro ribonucleoprotein
MSWTVTGTRKGASSKITCLDVAALFSAAVLRKNHDARIIPVDTKVHSKYRPEPRDSVMTNAKKLSKYGGGGTNLGAAVRWINNKNLRPSAVIFISDNESWYDPDGHAYYYTTSMAAEWKKFHKVSPKTKLVCIDIQPNSTTQAPDLPNEVLNIGGWSDQCFKVVDAFLNGNPQVWVDKIKRIDV